jgi:hypothetical protein
LSTTFFFICTPSEFCRRILLTLSLAAPPPSI